MTLEEFLVGLPAVRIVGGSPLYQPTVLPEYSISINGFRTGAYAAAINNRREDFARAKGFKRVLVPNPHQNDYVGGIFPDGKYPLPSGLEHAPTTCFSLLIICEAVSVKKVELFGVCGWASKWHDGDWEMHYIKRHMPNVTVHDPRPPW